MTRTEFDGRKNRIARARASGLFYQFVVVAPATLSTIGFRSLRRLSPRISTARHDKDEQDGNSFAFCVPPGMGCLFLPSRVFVCVTKRSSLTWRHNIRRKRNRECSIRYHANEAFERRVFFHSGERKKERIEPLTILCTCCNTAQ